MKTIYISGPITDLSTGQPREGWQQDFQEAEKKLRGMGFEVLNPIEIAEDCERQWKCEIEDPNIDAIPSAPKMPPHWYYLWSCIEILSNQLREDTLFGFNDFAGLYVIGLPEDIQRSFGTMTEINFAMSANLPVWSQYYHGYQIDNLLRQITTKPTLAEIQRTLNK
jgi:hypothetical protein